jgi:peptidoglycan/LPS O-acetylase OafA/YrhL
LAPVPGSLRATALAPRQPPRPTTAESTATRLSWLDALRGFAAITVVLFHLREYALDQVFALTRGWLSTGRYGVVLFFMVSGYVIPMSLQRYGSLRRFWVGRIFRVYPAFLLTSAAMGALVVLDVRVLPAALVDTPVAALLANATMLQELLGVPSFVYVFWTLSYEMTFYLLVSALFVFGLHRRCAWWSVLLAVAALAGGTQLPDGLLTGADRGPVRACLLAAAIAVASVAAYLRGRRRPAVVAGVFGLAIVALPAVNGAPVADSHAKGSWQALSFLAVMFAGTVVYAAHHGQLRRRTAALALGTVAACLMAAAWLHAASPGHGLATPDRSRREAVGTLVAVAATFAIGYALRHRRVPRFAAWLGRISYSMYLLHPIVLYLVAPHLTGVRNLPFAVQLVVAGGYVVVVLLVSWLSYVAVELPGQRLGRRVSQALDRRCGPDRSGPRPGDRRSVPVQTTPT